MHEKKKKTIRQWKFKIKKRKCPGCVWAHARYSPIYPGRTNQKGGLGMFRMRLSLVLYQDRKELVIVPRGLGPFGCHPAM